MLINLKNLIKSESQSSKILLVKYGNLGDIYILMNALKSSFGYSKDIKIEVAIPFEFIGLFKRHFKHIKVHPLPVVRKGLNDQFIVKSYNLMKQSYNNLIVTGGSCSPLEEDLAAVLVRAKRKCRVKPDSSKGNTSTRFIGGWFYDVEHESTSKYERDIIAQQLFLEGINRNFFDEISQERNSNDCINKLLIFPGASSEKRRWTFDTLKAICDLCEAQFPETKIVVCGSESDGLAYGEKLGSLRSDAVKIQFEDLPLFELENIIRACDLAICNDSGPLHIAQFFETETVCISGQGHLDRFVGELVMGQPRMECANCNWSCQFQLENGKYRCVRQLEGYAREIEFFRFHK